MEADIKSALAVKAQAIEVMKEHVYRGDYDRPRLHAGRAGEYRYKDRSIEMTCIPSHRDGWLDCMVEVNIVRRRLPLRKRELVLSTGYGVNVSTFRPGQWTAYLSSLAEQVRSVQREREHKQAQRKEEEKLARHKSNFSPVDDSSVFKK